MLGGKGSRILHTPLRTDNHALCHSIPLQAGSTHISGEPVLQVFSLSVRLPRLSLLAMRSSRGTFCSRRVTTEGLCSSWDRCSMLLYTCRPRETLGGSTQDQTRVMVQGRTRRPGHGDGTQGGRTGTLLKRGEQEEKRCISTGSSSLVSSSS